MDGTRYDEIVSRAVLLLQEGLIDGKSFDEIQRAESCIKSFCARDALVRACREIEAQLPQPRDKRFAILRTGDFRRAEAAIKKFIKLRDEVSTSE